MNSDWVTLLNERMEALKINSGAELARRMTEAGHPVTRAATCSWLKSGGHIVPNAQNYTKLASVLDFNPLDPQFLRAKAEREQKREAA